MKKITLTASQAREFAFVIKNDIQIYVKLHQAEYDAFLKAEMQKQVLQKGLGKTDKRNY